MVLLGNSTKGNARRIINMLKNFDTTREKISNSIKDAKKRKNDLEIALNQENLSYSQKLSELEKEVAEIKSFIEKSSDNIAIYNT